MRGLIRLRGCIQMTALLVCLCGFVRLAGARDIFLNNMKANRILFFGNSITICAPAPSIGWNNDWGMAASAAQSDYVHVLTKDVAQAAGGTPAIMATYNARFEWNYNSGYDWSSLQPQLDFKPDIVIVAIGENVAPLSTPQADDDFASAFTKLLNRFKSNGNPAIFVRSSFIADPTHGVMQQVANATGAVYVDQTWIGNDRRNHAYSEPYYANRNAFNGHPGDRGMAVIAGSLYDSMVAYSLTVPGPSRPCSPRHRCRRPHRLRLPGRMSVPSTSAWSWSPNVAARRSVCSRWL